MLLKININEEFSSILFTYSNKLGKKILSSYTYLDNYANTSKCLNERCHLTKILFSAIDNY